ncbi:MAG: hypothetical protein EZS28_034534 [Streblomastix strix]|uniref:DDE-1 domain-containing protein n=1 Tax=Streblomastix strix TaxID=222440 RepID=A0A5J4UHC5_9EUKA|nr:MAG: hypothetical protein EZS28_034534 [Streblomastix strix]
MDSTHTPVLQIRPFDEIVNSKEYIDSDQTELGIKSIKTARKNIKNYRAPGIVGFPKLLSEAQEDLLCQEICKKIKTKEFPDTLDAIQMAWNLQSISEDVKKKLNLSWMCNFIDRHKEFKFVNRHFLDCQRFQASTRRVIRPWLVFLIHLLTLWMIDIEDIWNLDESSLQIHDGKNSETITNTTLTVCCSGRGDMLKAQVIVHAKSIPSEFKRLNEDLFIVVCNDCGWQTIVTFEDYMVNYALPEIAHRRENNGVST